MIYLVTANRELFENPVYQIISVEESLKMLEPLKLIGFDTETTGLDCHVDKLLSMQFGCFDFQIVVDCSTVDPREYKELLESDNHLFLGWNLKFDGKFLLKHQIVVKHFYDGFLAEKLLWLGYPITLTPESWDHIQCDRYDFVPDRNLYILFLNLKKAGEIYLGIELDKSIRGQIIYKGLTPETIQYAADDVKYLEPLIMKQREKLAEKDLLGALEVENQFLLPLTYMEFCGVKLDEERWKAKMLEDQKREKDAKAACDAWLIEHAEKGVIDIGHYWIGDTRADDVDLKNLPDNEKEVWLKQRYWVSNEIDCSVFKKHIHQDFQGVLFADDLTIPDNPFDTEPKVTLNWNSQTQVIPIFKLFGVDVSVVDKEKGGMKDSVDAKVLKPQRDKCSLIPLYLKYREAVKVTSTYGDNFLKQINPVTRRLHTSFQQLGADTTRITSGGKDKAAKVEYINLLNLPSDAVTRRCFVSERGNRWISIDYSGQETYLMASIANDKAIIKELMEGSGDIHSLTAYMSYPEIPRDTPIKDIKKLYHNLRQAAKGIEFAINYGGDANTISGNSGISLAEATKVYNNYMSGFSGLKKYQDFRRKDWFRKGYILLSPLTGHKAFIYDYDELLRIKAKTQEEGFWDYYREMKRDVPSCDTVQQVRHFFKRKSASEKQSINYPMK